MLDIARIAFRPLLLFVLRPLWHPVQNNKKLQDPPFCRAFVVQKGLEVCYCLWGVPFRPSPGSYPGPVQVPSRVQGGPVQIRHVLCFTVFRTHPGAEVGAIPARLVPSCSRAFLTGSGLDGQKQTSWPLPSRDEFSF